MPSPHTLVIETSTPVATVALVGDEGVIEQQEFTSDRNHNALLFEPLTEMLERYGRNKIQLVLVGSGPGSYSGTRVGIAAAQGVAIALNCPATAVPSILAVPSCDGGATCLAIGDARRGSFWTASMHDSELTHAPTLCNGEELTAILANAVEAKTPIVSFEPAERFPVGDDLKSQIKIESPDATRLWQTWQSSSKATRDAWSSEIPQPIYLKPPHITPGKRQSLLNPTKD